MGEAIPFNSLSYVRRLRAVGVPEKQAEVQAEALIELIDSQLATKRDIKELELAAKHEIKQLELSNKHELLELELRIQTVIKELDNNLTLKMGALTGFTITVLAVLIKIF